MSDTEQQTVEQVPEQEPVVAEETTETVEETTETVEETAEETTTEGEAPASEETAEPEQEPVAQEEPAASPEPAAEAVPAGDLPTDLEGIWKAITSQKKNESPLNWVAVQASKKGEPELLGSGTDGLTGLKALMSQNDDKVVLGAIRILGVDEKNGLVSKRAKFAFCIYIGKKVSIMKRARASMQSENIRTQHFIGSQYTINVDDLDDFTPKFIGGRLLNAGGAHKPLRYEFGGGVSIDVADL